MALSIKANAEDLPSIFQILGLSQPPPVDASLAGAPGAPDISNPGDDAAVASQPKSVPTKLGRLQQIIQASQGNTDTPAMTDEHNSPSVTPPDVNAAAPSGPPVDMSDQMHKPSFLRQSADTGDASGGLPMGPEPVNVPAPPLNVGTGEVLPPDLTQADGGRPQLQKTWAQEHPGLAKILKIGLSAGKGAAAGAGSWTFGEGYQKAQELPLEIASKKLGLQQQAAQISNLPWQRAALIADLRHKGAQTDAESAKADKDRAEAGAVPTKQALEAAQALKEQFTVIDGVPYQYGKDANGKPTLEAVDGGAGIPASAEIAKVLNVKEGDQVSLTRALKAADLLTKGVTNYTTGEGVFEHNRITGTKTKLGTAPAIASINLQNGPYLNPLDASGNINPQLKAAIDNVGQYKVPLDQALSRVPAAGKAGFQTALKQIYPDYDSNQYAVKQAVLKDFASTKGSTAGGSALAFNTALSHLGLLNDAVDALGNSNVRLLNAIRQSYKNATGSPVGTNFDTIKQAVSGEVGKAFSGGNLTQGEQEAVKGPLDKANSPDQLKGAIKNAIKLMNGKLEALEFTRKNQLGPLSERTIISPEAAATRDRLLGSGNNSIPGSTTGTPPPNLPAHVQERDKKLGVVY